ncbi:RidA family protein [Novosphingobium flavum]|uniref:RidA family protein n=1 Tax=Novosphingobium flavum TaxID=1778672 RepID=A0A7X1FUK7_9SPHN|nr:RidA family protein [Novosphingobium flavum]MBC2667134.1 RidA family protein [Novosphingobium flavum]
MTMAAVRYENPEGSNPAQGLYSNVGYVEDGRIRMVAGQLAVGAEGEVVGVGDFDAQFHQVFDNLEAVIRGMGGTMASVLKFSTFVTDRAYIEPFMRLRAARFPSFYADEVYPPNTLLIVQGLVKHEFMIEVEAVVAI